MLRFVTVYNLWVFLWDDDLENVGALGDKDQLDRYYEVSTEYAKNAFTDIHGRDTPEPRCSVRSMTLLYSFTGVLHENLDRGEFILRQLC